MADLAKFQQETNAAYQPAVTSLQNQLGQLDKKLASTNQDIATQYAQQQAGLNRQRNMAAENASMQAAGSGGSFGGAANIANRKYYEQTFVPAQQNLQSNQAAAYKAAQEARDNSYDSLNNQLAQLQAEANRYALQRYDAAVEAERQAAEAEKNRQAQLKAQSNAWGYVGQGGNSGGQSRYSYGNDGVWYDNVTNKPVKAGTVANLIMQNNGGSYNDALREILEIQKKAGDSRSATALKAINKGVQFVYNGGNSYRYTGDDIFENLGIYSDDSRFRRK